MGVSCYGMALPARRLEKNTPGSTSPVRLRANFMAWMALSGKLIPSDIARMTLLAEEITCEQVKEPIRHSGNGYRKDAISIRTRVCCQNTSVILYFCACEMSALGWRFDEEMIMVLNQSSLGRSTISKYHLDQDALNYKRAKRIRHFTTLLLRIRDRQIREERSELTAAERNLLAAFKDPSQPYSLMMTCFLERHGF